VFSPVVQAGGREYPLVAEYSLTWEAPLIYQGFALTHCIMNAHGLAAAKADPKLVVLPSVHDRQPIDKTVAAHHAPLGVKPTMLLHEALEALAAHHPNFAPED
jgi:hypothetical protein